MSEFENESSSQEEKSDWTHYFWYAIAADLGIEALIYSRESDLQAKLAGLFGSYF